MTNEGGVRATRSLGVEVAGIWAQQLFEGRLALNPGLNLTRVSISFVQKYFLG